MYNTDIAIECRFNNIEREETNDISNIKILSYDLECTNGGTYFRSEKWERID